MNLTPAQLTVVAALGSVLATNHLLVRTELARRITPLFWLVNAVDASLAVYVCLVGVPGFPQGMVRLMVALVLLMHLAQNLQHRLRWAGEDREAALAEEYAAAHRLRQAAPSAPNEPTPE